MTSSAPGTTRIASISADDAPLHDAPDASSPVRATLALDTVVPLLETTGDGLWHKVQHQADERVWIGWVASRHVEPFHWRERGPAAEAWSTELAEVLSRGARFNRTHDPKFEASFKSMLAGMLASPDPYSRWLQGYVQEAGVETGRLGIGEADIALLRGPLSRDEILAGTPSLRATRSATTLLEAAARLRLATQPGAVLDVRHLLGAYIYDAAGHDGELARAGLSRPAWSHGFLGRIATLHPGELEAWKDLHRERWGAEPEVRLEPGPAPDPTLQGLSTHIATDLWTVEDALGYGVYARAIAGFITHRNTRPPLTISIQAPWGGGKTSLMRMIQHELDPDALADLRQEEARPRGDLTVGKALAEVERWIGNKTQRKLPEVQPEAGRKRLTVWFNAWKYESANQVWAGLADAIMKQVAARLPLAERETFWLRLNLKRVDADRIRQRIHERVFRYWWRSMRWVAVAGGCAVAAFALAFVAGRLAGLPAVWRPGLGLMGASVLAAAAKGAAEYLRAKKTVEKEPAEVSLGDFLDAPAYGKELGFIHQVEADLRRVLASVPPQYRPLVVFIDDLDRCSPAKVAQVVEAVNLFLAGEFPDCVFVMGMDTEMVAAALQAAHKDVVAQLPADAGIPVGWRFMDKFVQLPFLIPPPEDPDLERYTGSLFAGSATPEPRFEKLLADVPGESATPESLDVAFNQLLLDNEVGEGEMEGLRERLRLELSRRQLEAVRRRVDQGIESFTDDNPGVQGLLRQALPYFRGNPREWKRFVNAFRFHYCLWVARAARGLPGPSPEQVMRWTVLSMRWPEVVRWLRRSSGSDWKAPTEGAQATTPSRLCVLETMSGGARDLAEWQLAAASQLRLTPAGTSWLRDDDLLQFFHEEAQRPAGERLSDGAGKGLW